jgi:uncharacterized membrane protein YfcA
MDLVQPALLTILGAAAFAFVLIWLKAARRHPDYRRPSGTELAIGAVTDFFDTLGIGSFPTSTSLFRLQRRVRDEDIPGTLNVGHAPAAIAEALIFITAVRVDPMLLLATTVSTALGAWTGAGWVVRLPTRVLQWVLGLGSLVAGLLFIAVNVHWLPGGGEAFGLDGWRFALAIGATYVLGALMAAGVGFFGPCMIVLSLLGMHPIAAFPIMMSAGALQQLVSGIRYVRTGRYAFGPAVGLAFGGVVGVIVAAYLVKSLPVTALRWLVAGVALYVAASFLRTATRRSGEISAMSTASRATL